MKSEHTFGENKIYAEHHLPDEKSFVNPLVFVHGSFGGYWMWNSVVPMLVKKGFECVTLSLRGHKPSGGDIKRANMNGYVDDVALVVHELELHNPVVIGHSMGALVVLMYAVQFPVQAVVAIGPSPSREVQGEGSEAEIAKIPDVYTVTDVGMPPDPAEAAAVLPDIPKEMLVKMKDMLGPESGEARRDRKRGVPISNSSIAEPILFIGSEHGDSVGFGISFEKTKKMAEYYKGKLYEVKGATHPGIIAGEHAPETAEKIAEWLTEL